MPNFDSDNRSSGNRYIPNPSFSTMSRYIVIPKRYILSILTHIGLALIFAIRSNICTFKLDPVQFASLRASSELTFILGYFLVQIPAGILAYRYPPVKIFGLVIFSCEILGLLTPVLLKLFHVSILVYLGFAQGVIQGAAFPAAHGMWQHWAPPIERSTLISISYSGCFVGITLGAIISNWMCETLPKENVLIIYGLLGIVWYIAWVYLVYETPATHPTISETELQFLRQSIDGPSTTSNEANSIPWKSILKSKPLFAINLAFMCRTWSSYYLLQSDFTDFDFIHEYNVSLVQYPSIVIAVSIPIIGFAADKLLTRTTKSISYIRKLNIVGGFVGELLIVYLPSIFIQHHLGPLVMDIFVSAILYSCIICGYFVNHIDLAPKYASITIAISNMLNIVATMFIIMLPFTVPFQGEEDLPGYHYSLMVDFFFFAAATHLVAAIVYFIYGTGEMESWAKTESQENENRSISFSNNSVGV